MNNVAFTAFYNAVRTEHGAHLIALGWCNVAGFTASLELEKPSDFRFSLKPEKGGASAQVITPFAVTVEIPDDPRSVHVTDNHETYQVQVYGIETAGSGGNTSAKWVVSGKA